MLAGSGGFDNGKAKILLVIVVVSHSFTFEGEQSCMFVGLEVLGDPVDHLRTGVALYVLGNTKVCSKEGLGLIILKSAGFEIEEVFEED